MRTQSIVSSLVVVLALTACGDDDGAEGETGTGAGEPVVVAIGDFVFDPTPVEVEVGSSVVWENTHDQPHTSSGTGDQRWDTRNVAPGDRSGPVTFDEAGTYTYICGLHPFMEGTVEVSA